MNFFKGTTIVFLGFFIKAFLLILSDRYLAITLSPIDYGEFKFQISIVLILSIISGLGINSSIPRFIAINRNNIGLINNILFKSFLFISAFCGFLFLIFYPNILQNLLGIQNYPVFRTILITVFFIAQNSFFHGIYSGFFKPLPKTIINDIIGPILFLLVVYYSYKNSFDFETIALLYTLYLFLVFILNFIFVAKKAGKIKSEKLIETKQINSEFISFTTPLYFTSILIGLSVHFDKLILGQTVSRHDLGIYYSAFTLANILPIILTVFLFLYLPTASRYFNSKKFILMSLINSYMSKWTMLFSFIPFWVLFYYSSEVIDLIFNEEYTEANLVLKILAMAQFINVSLGFTGQNLIAMGDSLSQLKIRIIGLIILITFGVILSTNYGVEGIAISVLIGLLVTNILQIATLFIKFSFNAYSIRNIIAFMFIIVLGLLLYYIHSLYNFDYFLLNVIVDGLIFVAATILLGLIGKKDFRVLKLLN